MIADTKLYHTSLYDEHLKLNAKMLPYEITKEHGHMIDFEFDFKVAELLFNQKKRRK